MTSFHRDGKTQESRDREREIESEALNGADGTQPGDWADGDREAAKSRNLACSRNSMKSSKITRIG